MPLSGANSQACDPHFILKRHMHLQGSPTVGDPFKRRNFQRREFMLLYIRRAPHKRWKWGAVYQWWLRTATVLPAQGRGIVIAILLYLCHLVVF